MNRKSSFSGIFPSVEGKTIRTALTLSINVDTPDLIGECINQTPNLGRVSTEDAQLLTEVGLKHVIDHCF
ncbi:hypothetical protein D3C86_1959480 [compost metagenome]